MLVPNTELTAGAFSVCAAKMLVLLNTPSTLNFSLSARMLAIGSAPTSVSPLSMAVKVGLPPP